MADNIELLFFDTFSHESSDELNLDLVQFPKPVYISEVRIIPLGARVQSDFPGGVRLGATNPSQFAIEFFVNDLSKPGASTFESLGGVEYKQNGVIHLETDRRQVPTDGLVLRGWYTTITLAVYGSLTKGLQDLTSPPAALVAPHPAPPCPPDAVTSTAATAEWVQQHAQVVELVGVERRGYMVEPPSDYVGTYPTEAYPPAAEYPPYEWPEQQQQQQQQAKPEPPVVCTWEREDEAKWDPRKESSRHREYRDRSRSKERDWEYRERDRDRDWNHRPRASWGGDKQRPRSPKRPHTPPPAVAQEKSVPRRAEGSEPAATQVKKEVLSPSHSSIPAGPPHKFESLSPGDVESISDGEISPPPLPVVGPSTPASSPNGPTPLPIPATPPTTEAESPLQDDSPMDIEQFEPILSDEDILDETDPQFQDLDYDFGEYEDSSKTFNPFTCEFQPLSYLPDPSIAVCKAEESRLRRVPPLPGSAPPVESIRLEELVSQYKRSNVTSRSDLQEDWVHTIEQAPSLLAKGLLFVSDREDAVSTLLEWVNIGLDFETAVNQPQPGYKVRHLKAGIRLAEALCQCGEDYTRRLLETTDLQRKLLKLYAADYMALSIKLMILKALEISLNSRHSVERFLGRRAHVPNMHNGLDGDKEKSGYRTLIQMARENQLARAKFAISCLLRKIHLFEILERLNTCVKRISEDLEKSTKARTMDSTPEPVSESDAETIVACLEEISRIYQEAPVLLSQPKRFLPVCAQFEIFANVHDPYPALFAFFRCHQLLEILLVLLSCPITSSYSMITSPVQDILSTMLDSQSGLQYLFANLETTSALARLLLSSCVGPDEVMDEGSVSSPLQHLGLTLVYRMQALQFVDALFHLGANIRFLDPDSSEVLENLHGLYCLGFSPAGKAACIHVLSRGNNIKTLLRFFTQPENQTFKTKKSPGKCYSADLILQTVKFSDHVPFLQRFGKEILIAGLRDEKTLSSRLHEVVPWLRPVDNLSVFAYDDIGPLSDIVQRSVENVTSFPGELYTALRILKYLGVQEKDLVTNETDGEEYIELKYKYVILQLFSREGIGNLTAILQKLCENYEQPMLHATCFLGSHGLSLVSLVLPSVQLIRRMLTHVIHCRNTRFKDLTAVPILLKTYSLINTFPSTAMGYADSRRVCREIVETLLAYTQPIATENSSETEALHKSLWTLMMSEVVKYIVTGPNTFVSGLLILSELLPLPLPIQTRTPLPESETQRTVNGRKLWSAHLHSLGSGLQEFIATMSGSSFQPLLQLLRRVCVQLSDLAAPTALIVTRGVLDPIISSLVAKPDETSKPICSGHTARLLNFLACLVTHPPIKSAVLHLLTGSSTSKTDEHYPGLIASLCNILRTSSETPPHIQAQECVVSIIQSLCDVDITLVAPPGNTIPWEASGDTSAQESYLSNALPQRDLLVTLCSTMLEHVANTEHSITTLLPTLRTFLMLSEHDYGFYHLKTCLDKNPTALENLFIKIYTSFSKDSSDCMTTLSISLEFLRVCITLDVVDETLPPRTLVMTVGELAVLLGWAKKEKTETVADNETKEVENNSKKHPIFRVEKLLQECSPEEETLENLQENVSYLIRLLEDEGGKTADSREWQEPLLPGVEPLLAQFAARQVVVLGDAEEERLAPSFWLAPPPVDEADQDMDQVVCDLMELSREFLPDFQLASEAERLCRVKNMVPHDETDDIDLIKKRGDDSKFLASETRNKRPFVTPMRGRGFGRAAPQRGDLFRSRPPNTSRPPSLHVDDFVALEISGQQPTGPTGYNKISMRAAKDMMSARGRGGRGRGAFPQERGRFFNPTASYRRENGRGPGRGGAGRGGAPSPNNWADTNNSQPLQQRSFRTPEHRMMPRSEEKFPRFVGGRGIRPPGWNLKDGRERFTNPNNRGGPRRDPSIRHARTFTR